MRVLQDTASEMVRKRDEAPATEDASKPADKPKTTTPVGKPEATAPAAEPKGPTTSAAEPKGTAASAAEPKATTPPAEPKATTPPADEDEDEFRDPELKRLDAELMKELDETKALLSGYNQRMLDLVTAEEDRVLDEISQLVRLPRAEAS